MTQVMQVVLDPVEVSISRSSFPLNTYGNSLRIDVAGIDWGDAAITAYMADERYGSNKIDFRIPNRMIRIPLFLGASENTADFKPALQALRQKVALLQREGGWLKRQTGLYADVINATLTLPDIWGEQGYVEDKLVLTLECLPDFYGDEIELTELTGTGFVTNVLPNPIITENYVLDPSFEYDTAGSAPAVGATTNLAGLINNGATVTAQTTYAQSGTKSGRIVTTAALANEGYAQSVGVLTEGTYTFSFYVRSASGGETVHGLAGPNIPGTFSNYTSFAVTSVFTRHSITFVADGVTEQFVAVRNGAVAGSIITVYVDNLMVNVGSVAGSYADGDSSGWSWTGVAGRSLSEQPNTGVAMVTGDYPARVRLIATDQSGNNQQSLIWGFRSRYSDFNGLANLAYDANTLTGLNSAASAADANATGGTTLQATTLPVNTWSGLLDNARGTDGALMQHIGTYRVWIRAYAGNSAPSFRLVWGVGSLASPAYNTSVQIPGSGAYYLLDLGVISLTRNPAGPYAWHGVVQALLASTDTIRIDMIYFQPLDESAGTCTSVIVAAPPGAISSKVTSTNSNDTDNSGTGTVAWTTGSSPHVALTPGQQSHYLRIANLGFAIPGGATILGVQAQIGKQAGGTNGTLQDYSVFLMKALAVTGSSRAVATIWDDDAGNSTIYGGPSDLWGTTLTPTDVNNTGFGAAISVFYPASSGSGSLTGTIGTVTFTVTYTLGGATISTDVVIPANGDCEVRTDGCFRPDPVGAAWAAVSVVTGDLPRLPPSGLENRTVEVFSKPSRGILKTSADNGLDASSVRIVYRPCYLGRLF